MRDYSYEDLHSLATDAEHKEFLLEMMIEWDNFCKENNLKYYLSGGTLLGAIRHKGFIPWDDDVDVNMPRPDCERLMELSGGKIGRYKLLPPNHTDRYHAYHWKLYDDFMLVGKRKQGELSEVLKPIFIDIFPIDGLPDTAEQTELHYDKIIECKKQINVLWGKGLYGGRDPFKRYKSASALKRAERIGRDKLFQRVIDVAKSIPYEDAEHIGVMMTDVHTTEERVLKSEYSPVIEVDFEGRKFPAPAGYDTYLRQLYGDNYMEWLPVHQRISRHALIPFHSTIGKPMDKDTE